MFNLLYLQISSCADELCKLLLSIVHLILHGTYDSSMIYYPPALRPRRWAHKLGWIGQYLVSPIIFMNIPKVLILPLQAFSDFLQHGSLLKLTKPDFCLKISFELKVGQLGPLRGLIDVLGHILVGPATSSEQVPSGHYHQLGSQSQLVSQVNPQFYQKRL